MKKLKFLGYGNSFSTKTKNTSAYFLYKENFILFDCGENIFDELRHRRPYNTSKKIIILLTHFHSDHVGSLGSFVFFLRNEGFNKNDILIFNPETKNLKNLINLFDISEDCQLLKSLDTIFGDKIYVVKQKHYKKYSYGYAVLLDDMKFFYSGDTSELSSKILNNIDNFEYLYVDTALQDQYGYHMTIAYLKNMICMQNRKKIVCIHLPDNLTEATIIEAGFNIPQQT